MGGFARLHGAYTDLIPIRESVVAAEGFEPPAE